jgi:hypothetical protein
MRQKLIIARGHLQDAYKMAEVFTREFTMKQNIDNAISSIDSVLSSLDEMRTEGTYAN